MSNPDDLLTTAEVARIVGRSVPTIHRWVESGRLPTARKLPGIRGARLFRRSDVDALLAPEAAS